jgi:hypothetical protein
MAPRAASRQRSRSVPAPARDIQRTFEPRGLQQHTPQGTKGATCGFRTDSSTSKVNGNVDRENARGRNDKPPATQQDSHRSNGTPSPASAIIRRAISTHFAPHRARENFTPSPLDLGRLSMLVGKMTLEPRERLVGSVTSARSSRSLTMKLDVRNRAMVPASAVVLSHEPREPRQQMPPRSQVRLR